MKAIRLYAANDIRVDEIPAPKMGEGLAMIKIVSMGICGSDITAYRGLNPQVKYPLVLGHELGGIVLEIGENAKGIRPGDRVAVDPYVYCGKCYPCSLGRTNCCRELKVLGTQIDGGMQEILAHPAHLLHRVPEGVRWEQVPVSETMSVSLHSLRRARVESGKTFAVFGAGPIGLLAALLAKNMGARPILIDVLDARLERARKMGIEYTVNSMKEDLARRVAELTDGRMAESVLEASGANPAIVSAFEIASHAGTVALTGWPKKKTEFDTGVFTRKELDVRGSRVANREFEDCLDIIANREIDMDAFITRTCAFEEIPDMVRAISQRPEDYLKVVGLFDAN